MRTPRRGEVWKASLSEESQGKLWLILSPNHRNKHLGEYLAVRVTSTSKWAHLPTWVAVPPTDHACIRGYINTETLTTLYPSDFDSSEPECSVGRATFEAIRPALLEALGY